MTTKIEILKDGQVVNTIVASVEFAEKHYPGAWRLVEPDPETPVPEPVVETRLTVLEFRNRFTFQEKGAIELAAIDDPSGSQEARLSQAMLRAVLADIAAATFISLSDPNTIAGVQLLRSMGIISEERETEILTL